MDVFLSHLPRDEVTGIHLYVEDAEEGADFQSRMFAPLHGVFEDPATGSANVALIGTPCSFATRSRHCDWRSRWDKALISDGLVARVLETWWHF